MTTRVTWLVALLAMTATACGRINYDPLARRDAGLDGDVPIDAPGSDADARMDGAFDSPFDSSFDGSMDDMGGGTVGIVVTPTSGLMTTEAGGIATFTIVLSAEPTGDVTIDLSSSDTEEGVVTPISVTFTTANWNAPRTITVTGVDDTDRDGDQNYTILTAAASSSDVRYDMLDASNVEVTNRDDESPSIVVSRTSGLVTDEGGGSDTFTVALNTAPTLDVTIEFMSDTPLEATVAPLSVTFTSMNWSSPVTITATGVDDIDIDGDMPFTVIGTITTDDVDYGTVMVPEVTGVNRDNETPGILVDPVSGLTTSESGGTAMFTIVLQAPPVEDVTIPVVTSDDTEGTPSVALVTFTPTNWNVPQAITVTGVDDSLTDGDQIYSIEIGPSASLDPGYDMLSGDPVVVTNTDDESAGFEVTPATGLVTTEGGGTATFTVVLRSVPMADVTFDVTSSETMEGTVTPITLTFTPGNWDTPQSVTVTGVDDLVADGDQAYQAIVHVSGSADPDYAALSDRQVELINTDDESAGITVTPTTGLVTTEAGGTASFTVVLNSAPTDDVRIDLSSDVPLEGTVLPASLTFTMSNWNVPQTVTVTGVDDAVADGSRVYHIVTANAVSTDVDYNDFNVSDVTVTNMDDDTVGVTVTPTSGLTTTEAGGSVTFTMVLTSQPTADVTFDLMSSDTTEGTVSSPSVTFTMGNWNTPQTVTVTGVDDLVADGNVMYSVITAAATSSDSVYSGFDPSDVSLTNTDNDMSSVIVMPTSGLTTTELGGTADFTVVLGSQPTASVTISLMSSDTTEGTIAMPSLMFTTANWNMPQTVTVTGIDDAIVDGDVAYSIITGAATSTDVAYSGLAVADVSLTNTDDDVADVTVTPTFGLVTSEAGGTATFTLVLTSQPTANVTISLTSSNLLEGTVAPATVTFTSSDWNLPQTVTVTGVDDALADGNVAYTIVTGAAVSTDLSYSARAVADVSVTNNDNDAPGVTVSPTAGLTTTEAGGTATFTVVLASMPTANVTVSLMSSNVNEGTVSPASVLFTTLNWNTPQTVTITGVNDSVADGNVMYTIVTGAAVSTDPGYSGLAVSDVSVSNTDNDVAGVTVSPTSGLVTTEAGGTATFTLVLTSQPTANVTISLMTSNAAEGTVAPASVTFTNMNWSMAQTVTVTGVDDAVVDGNVAYSIVTGAAASTDGAYSGRVVADVTATNTDNDTASVTVTPSSGLMTTEAGGTATFTLVLTSQPTANVTISLMTSNAAEGTVAPASVTFTALNWSMAQTITVTGVDDAIVDGNVSYSVITGAATSTDTHYSGVAVDDVSVTNADNDTAGVTVTPTSGLTTTELGGTATFTVVLTSQPTSGVSISLTSSNSSEGTVSPASVAFTTGNWNVAQTVTVTGVNDAIDDGNVVYSIVTGNGVSTDTNYSGRVVSDVSVTNTDDDTTGVTVTPTSGLVTTEAGGTATFTVVLTSQPTANVTISLMSTTVAEGTVAPASLTFTNMNWNVAQTVTVTGVNDSVVDGNVAYTIVTGAAVSTDTTYGGVAVADVSVTNNDNDTGGVTVTPTSGLMTTEAGGTATFTVVLTSQPTANVTISLMSSNTLEGTVSPASVLFTNLNWNMTQTVTVTGVNDAVVDGNIAYSIVTGAAASSDGTYNGMAVADVSVTNNDNDTGGVTVTPTSGLTTTEAGGTATFTVVLTSQPTANVTISLMSSNTLEGTVSPASLTFTNMNWSSTQTVTITGVNDSIDDGNIAYTIVTGAAVSTDGTYSGMAVSDVSVSNTDNDTAAITVTPTSGLNTTEAGGTASFTIVLVTQPTADVTISLTSSDLTEGTVAPASVTFTSMNWNSTQTITLTGVDDALDDGNIAYTITTGAATSTDGAYSGMVVADVSVTNTDNETADITVNPTNGLTTTEAGGTATFTVLLTSQPTADVTISLMSSNTNEGTVAPASLTFTAGDWNIPQTVTITGVNDAADDGNIAYTIVTGAAASADLSYNGIAVADVSVTNTDNDTAGITVSPTAGLVTTEAGGTATFTVVLTSQPSSNVTVSLASSNTNEGTVSPASLTFTNMNWSSAQTVTVTGVNDSTDDGDIVYSIVTGAAVSVDGTYSGMAVADVSVTNTDNDSTGVTVNPTMGLTTTEAGGTATFTVVLTSQPTANVTISLMSSNTGEGTVAPASVTFTNMNWASPQTVTITGANDAVVDGDVGYSIITGAAASTDLTYSALAVSDVSVTNTDNDTAGITVTPTSGLVTTEALGTATFTVVLTSQPTANVTVSLMSSNTLEGTVSPASVTFTNVNWASPQTVTVTGVNDFVDDGNVSYTIVTGAAVSTDGTYSGMAVSDVSVSNTDNDSTGVTVTPTSGLTTTEAGATATFTMVLTSQPTANVTISLTSNTLAEGTVSPASVTFTNVNWNSPQTVTVTGVNDSVVDGNVAYTIVTGAAVSTDLTYSGLAVSDVSVTNNDNDTGGVTVSPTSGLTTTEAGGTATFTVVLTSQPTANVTISLMSSNTSEGTVSPASVMFTSMNWNSPQTVTVTGVNDAVVDGNVGYSIVTGAAASADGTYSGMAVSDVSVTNNDNDTASITVTPTSGLTTTEAGGTASFTVVLTSQPTANVTISIMSSNTNEGTVSPASLTFTTMNWNSSQMVTITGVNDSIDDGNVAYTIVTGAAASTDGVYNGMAVSDVSVSNTDNDTAGITVTPTSGLNTTEAGGTATFTVVLTSQPTANVTISLMTSDATEGSVSPASLTFTNMNWSSTQTVTLTGVDDALADGNIAYTIITGAAASADGSYNGMAVADVAATNTDNETAGVTVNPTSGLTTTEAGGTATFTVVLTSQPTANVTISLMTSDVTEGTVSPASLTFTNLNWNSSQMVTITGVNDSIDDGNIAYTIVTGAAVSADGTYSGMAVSDVSVTNTDDDSVGVTVNPTMGLTTTEAGGTATFTVVLTSQPTADVTISLMSSNTGEGTVSPASLTFTSMNWSSTQMVTVTGVNDSIDDGNVAYTIVTGAAASADGTYNGLVVSDVSATNTDNDSAGVTVNPTMGLTTTEAGGTASFTVVLTSQPTANVTISIMSSNTSEGTVSPASLTFTTMNWSSTQMVTITGVNDSIDDGNVAYTIVTGAAASTDGTYSGMAVSDVSVSNTDNDSAGVTVNPTMGLTTTEAGGTASFTVVLTSQPTANVVISLTSSDTTEGTVSPASVTFTNMNWSSTQTVTVTGVNDDVDDGNVAYTITTGAAASTDGTYSGMAVSDVSVSNTDNDAAGVTVSPTSGLTTTEAGGTATFTVVLTSQPTANVTISLTSSDTTEGTVSPASVTFTNANWASTQSVTITGVNDDVDDGNVAYTITTGAAVSADGSYSGMAVSDVSVSNTDNDTAGVTVNPTSGLTTTEALGTASFTVVLNSQPTANVTISLTSSDTTEGTVSPASVTFTTANWSSTQMVTITGVNDDVDDGNVAYTITTGAAVSADGAYSGMAVSDVSVSNTDNDTAGVTVNPTSGLTTTEALGTASFTVVLNSQPTANVTISLTSSDTTEGTVSPASVTFTTANWSSTQMVTVTGVNDDIDDGNIAYTITTGAAVSADGAYSGMAVSDVSVSNTDNDTAGVTVTPTSGLLTSEGGGDATFTMVLTSQPTANVTISLTSTNTAEGTVSPSSVTFTNGNWSVAQVVTVSGVDDGVLDGNIAYTITTGAAASADGSYNGLAVSDVSVTNISLFTYIKASNTGASDNFGDYATSLSSDGNTLAVGAWLEDSNATGINGTQSNNSATDSGAVYVFVRTAGIWTQQAYIKASNTGASDYFGQWVVLSHDGNTLAVGAPEEDSSATGINGSQANGANQSGAAYVFTRSGSTWSQQAYIKASNTEGDDNFGLPALSGDGNTLAVGAPNEASNATGINGNQANNSASQAGAVYVFTRSGSTWTQQAYVKAGQADGSDYFGSSIGLSTDGNTMAVGSAYESGSSTGIDGPYNNSASAAGCVHVFTRSGTTWSQQAYIKASNTEADDNFGAALTLSADGDTLAVGAPNEDSSATGINGNQSSNAASNSGAVYVFTRSGAVWSQQAYIKPPNTGADDEFGGIRAAPVIALSGDGNILVASSRYEDGGATGLNGAYTDTAFDSGAVYRYTRSGSTWTFTHYIKASNAAGGDAFAWVSMSSDGSTVAIGATYEDSNATGINGNQANNSTADSGAVYVLAF